MQTAYPAEVVSYNSADSTATVKPLFVEAWRGPKDERVVETPENADDGDVENVLVMHPRAGNFRVSLPVAPGHTGLVVCTKFSLDRFRADGGQSDPGDIRKFTMNGSVFFPCNLYPDSDPLDASDDDSLITLSEGGTLDFIALAAKVKTELDEIKAGLDKYDAHTHNYIPPTTCGGGATATTGPSVAHGYTATSVANTKVKVE